MSRGEAARAEPSAGALSFAYVTNFAALASSAPFFAVYLGGRGFDGEEISTLLAALLLVNVVGTLAWTALADKLGSIGTVLRIVSVGSVACAAPAFFGSRLAVIVGLLALAACRAPFGALLDASLLRTDRPFGPVRAWGTAGYVTGALAAGLATKLLGAQGIAFASVAFMGLAALASFFVPSARVAPSSARSATPVESAPFSSRLGEILARPRFLLLLAIALLSEVGLAPYDALFPAYLTRLADGVYASAALATGAVAEFLFLLALGRGTHRSRAGSFLVLAGVCSTLRWAIVGLVTSPGALVATQALHAFGFGAFYVGSILLVDEESPSSPTMSQGVFRAFTFGLAPAAVLFLTGRVEPQHGLRGVFLAAAVAALVATALALKVRAMSAKARARILLP